MPHSSQVQAAPCYCQPCPLLLPTLPRATAKLLLLLPLQTSQVQAAGPQRIVLDTMSGWGVNGSLVTLLPDTPLPAPLPSSASGSTGLSAGAVAGIVVGSCVGAALLVGLGMLLLLRQRRWVSLRLFCGGP